MSRHEFGEPLHIDRLVCCVNANLFFRRISLHYRFRRFLHVAGVSAESSSLATGQFLLHAAAVLFSWRRRPNLLGILFFCGEETFEISPLAGEGGIQFVSLVGGLGCLSCSIFARVAVRKIN